MSAHRAVNIDARAESIVDQLEDLAHVDHVAPVAIPGATEGIRADAGDGENGSAIIEEET